MNNKQNWEGLWLQNGTKEIWKSKVLDLRELVAMVGSEKFRILMVRNIYYNGNNKQPQYRFVLVKPDQQDIPVEDRPIHKEKYYTQELVDNDDLSWY